MLCTLTFPLPLGTTLIFIFSSKISKASPNPIPFLRPAWSVFGDRILIQHGLSFAGMGGIQTAIFILTGGVGVSQTEYLHHFLQLPVAPA